MDCDTNKESPQGGRETPEDIEHENIIAKKLEDSLGVKLERTEKFCPIDFWFTYPDWGLIIAAAEVTWRKYFSYAFPNVYLSVCKWEAMKAIREDMNISVYFVVHFLDKLMSIEFRDIDTKIRILRDRIPRPGAAHDIEELICVSIRDMKEVVRTK